MTGVPLHAWPKRSDEYKSKIIIAEKIDRFLKQTSNELTLGEFLQERLPTGPINQNKNRREVAEINMVELLLDSEYKDITESMNSNQLASLSSIFSKDSVNGSYPKEIIRNRALASAKGSKFYRSYVTRYLSQDEKLSLGENDQIDALNSMIVSSYVQDMTPMVVFAAIAEVIAVRGFSKAFEVASELKHLSMLTVSDLKIYEATVALIAEALEADDEMPFGWAAQMSEHSWVLTSHRLEDRMDLELLKMPSNSIQFVQRRVLK